MMAEQTQQPSSSGSKDQRWRMVSMVRTATFPRRPRVFQDRPSVRMEIWAKDLPFHASSASYDDFGTKSSPESRSAGAQLQSPLASRESGTC